MYKRPDPHGQGGAQYVLESTTGRSRYLGISRNFRYNTNDEHAKYYIKIRSDGTEALALTDEQMQELFYAYLALRKEYEDAQR